MQNSKKKFYVMFGIMLAVVLALIVSLVSVVFSYTQQTVRTHLNINYTAIDVDGYVEATYAIGNTTNYLQRADGQGTRITFDASETSNQNASLVFPIEKVNLTSTNKSVIITYMFTNTGGNEYTALISLSQMSQTNMSLEFSQDGEIYTEDQYALVVESGETCNYYIKITVKDVSHSASFTGDISWLLENYEPVGEETEPSMSSTTFTLNEETQTYTASYNGEPLIGGQWIVASHVGSVPVTEIVANTSLTNEQKEQVTSIVIPNTVTTIGDSAFSDYTKLQSVTFAENSQLTSIGGSAFYDCDGLTSIEIPASVTSIEWMAFMYCSNLTSVTFAENSQLTIIGEKLFVECTSLTSIEIPASVIRIYDAFYGCISLKNVTFAENSQLASIENSAFHDCEGLTSIVIPDTVTYIGYYAFDGCTSLTSVIFEDKTVWYAGSTKITETQLSDPANAATLLTSTYCGTEWIWELGPGGSN